MKLYNHINMKGDKKMLLPLNFVEMMILLDLIKLYKINNFTLFLISIELIIIQEFIIKYLKNSQFT